MLHDGSILLSANCVYVYSLYAQTVIIISNYIKVRPKASGAGLVCRTDQYFQCQRLMYACRIKTVKSVR